MADGRNGNNNFDTVALRGRQVTGHHRSDAAAGELKRIELSDQRDIREAIYKLKVRGAPAIGVAAAISLYLRGS